MTFSLAKLLREQDSFEQQMGWHTGERIAAAEDEARTRQEELEYASYRLDQELRELQWAARQYEMFGRFADEIRDGFAERLAEWDAHWDKTNHPGSWFQRNRFQAPTTEEYLALCGEEVREDLLRDAVDWEQYGDRFDGDPEPDEYVEETLRILDDHIGHEAVDAFLFARKVGQTLDDDITSYFPDGEREEADRYEQLAAQLRTVADGTVDHTGPFTAGYAMRDGARRAGKELTPRTTREYCGEQVRDNLWDDIFEEARDQRAAGTYDAETDEQLGRRTAQLMQQIVGVTRSLDRSFADYVQEKLETNITRTDDFGVDDGYGEVADYFTPTAAADTGPA